MLYLGTILLVVGIVGLFWKVIPLLETNRLVRCRLYSVLFFSIMALGDCLIAIAEYGNGGFSNAAFPILHVCLFVLLAVLSFFGWRRELVKRSEAKKTKETQSQT